MTKQHIGNYFGVSLDEVLAILSIHTNCQSAEINTTDIVAAYVILCRGAGKDSTTQWKAFGVSKYTNMTSRRAGKALDWLVVNDFLAVISEVHASKPQQAVGKFHSDSADTRTNELATKAAQDEHRYEIVRHRMGKCVYLPNLLIDGQRGHTSDPALKRLTKNCQANYRTGVDLADATLDAVVLLLALYYFHDLDAHGGIDRQIWQRVWSCSEAKEDFENRRSTSSIGDDRFDVVSARAEDEKFDTSSLIEMFAYIDDERQRRTRIEHALKNLRALRFLYQVIQIWGKSQNKLQYYSPFYPLHIIDKAQRDKNEPAVGPIIDRLILKYSHLIPRWNTEYAQIAERRETDTESGNAANYFDCVFFVAAKGLSMLPISTLRLRYRPHDADTGKGMEEQTRLAQMWMENVETLPEHAAFIAHSQTS